MELSTNHLVLAPDASIDLQMHTTYSDGAWTPEQLIDYLVGEKFGLVAITDHDRVDTIASLQYLAVQKQLPVLVAAEMSTSWKGEATDVLCYSFDPQEKELQDLAQDVLRRQQEITQDVYQKLLRKGYVFPRQQEVLKESGGEPSQANDLAALLEQHGYGDEETSFNIVFDEGFFFATNDIAAVVDAVHHSGGVCLIAHPGRGKTSSAMMSPCWINSVRKFPLTASRLIILYTRQNKPLCIWSMLRTTIYWSAQAQTHTAQAKNQSNTVQTSADAS